MRGVSGELDGSAPWPTFGEPEAPLPAWSAPPYLDSLLVVVLLLVALAVALTHVLLRPRGRGRALSLLTAPPTTIARAGEMVPRVPFFLLGLPASVLVVSLLLLLLLPAEMGVAEMAVGAFWLRVGQLSLLVLGLFGIASLLRAWMVYTFCPADRIPLWWADYQLLRVIASMLLLLPLLLLLLTTVGRAVAGAVGGGIYLLYRLALCSRELELFPHLMRYPLHIILYLCACEIGPLLFLWGVLSVNSVA